MPGGRLTIAWGFELPSPEQVRMATALASYPPDAVLSHFHANAFDNRPDPFHSKCFGAVLEALLDGRHIAVTDSAFEDPTRREALRAAFQRVLPDVQVDQVLADRAVVSGTAGVAE